MKTVTVRVARTRSLHRRHPWIFANSIVHCEPGIVDGDVVAVRDEQQRGLGSAFYAAHGGASAAAGTGGSIAAAAAHAGLALRMVRFDPGPVDEALIRDRLAAARARRRPFVERQHLQAWRWCFSEGDLLPGLIIDGYRNSAVIQYLCPGMARFAPVVRDWLIAEAGMTVLVEKPNRGAGTKTEELRSEVVYGELDGPVEYDEHGVVFPVDLLGGQKTGFYLDQRENRARVRELAAGKRVLDLFCYTGGFAISAAVGGARAVTAVDASAAALELLARGAARNGVTVITHRQNVFTFLQEAAGEYDLIVIDPPALASRRAALDGAKKSYFYLLQRALKLLARGGYLLVGSCSHHFGFPELREALTAAAGEQRCDLHLIGWYGQPFDHPAAAGLPEGEYLRLLLAIRN